MADAASFTAALDSIILKTLYIKLTFYPLNCVSLDKKSLQETTYQASRRDRAVLGHHCPNSTPPCPRESFDSASCPAVLQKTYTSALEVEGLLTRNQTSGIETRGSIGSMNRGPKLQGAPESGAGKILRKKIICHF